MLKEPFIITRRIKPLMKTKRKKLKENRLLTTENTLIILVNERKAIRFVKQKKRKGLKR